uniref:CSON012144 protein n=1 Tax=Culicoides sonorensis TaxID=179676 RepID=A0A336MA94_CULSO
MKLVVALLSVCLMSFVAFGNENKNHNKWRRPGCFKVGHRRDIQIVGCTAFTLNSNACRGFCESYAVPAPPLLSMPNKVMQNITSIGQCCNMMEEEDITVLVSCLSDEGEWENRNVTFKSAKKCSCYLCKDADIPTF